MTAHDGLHFAEGGMLTARVPTAPHADERARRAQQAAAARRYVTRTGNADLLPILGLDGQEDEPRRCANSACGGPIVSVKTAAKYCTLSCASAGRHEQLQAARRRRRATAT